MISAEFVGGPWCGQLQMLQDLVREVAVYGCDGHPPKGIHPDSVPSAYLVGSYFLRPHQHHAGPYWYDWSAA